MKNLSRIFLCLLIIQVARGQLDSSQLPLEHRGGGGPVIPQGYSGGPQINAIPDDPWPIAPPTDMPQISNLQVQCEKNHMRVNVEFDRPFYGMIFSKGHYSDPSCVHLQPQTGQLSATFDIFLNTCGMTSSANSGGNYGQPSPSGTFVENTVIIQYDQYVQEVWDQARKLRCTWYDYYEKSVTFRPFQVDMLNAVTANFLGDNLQCWMQIQVGKGPWASEVSGIVKIGQTMTMVLAIKDDENKFDMLVRNCVAHDGKRAPIQLVDEFGCVARPKIMAPFQKIKNFGSSASVVSYAYFQAFKFPDSMNVHFQCVIQVCRYQCPEPQCGGTGGGYGGGPGVGDPRIPAGSQNIQPAYSEPPPPPVAPQGYSDNQIDGPPIRIPQPAPIQLNPHSINVPPPPRVPPGYTSIKREGLDADVPNGRPRSIDASVRRRRREVEMTDIETSRVIQVVAPGDVAFNLNTRANETVVVSSSDLDSNSFCMSYPFFISGLTMLLVVLIVASIIAAFFFIRVRQMERKGSSTTIIRQPYDQPEFVQVAN